MDNPRLTGGRRPAYSMLHCGLHLGTLVVGTDKRMSKTPSLFISTVNACGEASRKAFAWIAIPLLGSLPWWLLVATGLHTMWVPSNSTLTQSSTIIWATGLTCALALAAYSRCLWTSCIRLTWSDTAISSRVWNITWTAFLRSYLLHLLCVIVITITSWSLLPLMLFPWLFASAAVVPERSQLSMKALIAHWMQSVLPLRLVLSSLLVIAVLFLLIGGNIWMGLYAIAWALSQFGDLAALRLHDLLSPLHPATWIGLSALTLAVLDPLIVALVTAAQFLTQSRNTGADLQHWLRRLEQNP